MTTPLITNYDLGEEQFNYSNEFIPNVNIIHPRKKVGIGTSDPQYTMDVRNSINVKSNIDVSGSFRFESKPGITYNSNYIHVLFKEIHFLSQKIEKLKEELYKNADFKNIYSVENDKKKQSRRK